MFSQFMTSMLADEGIPTGEEPLSTGEVAPFGLPLLALPLRRALASHVLI